MSKTLYNKEEVADLNRRIGERVRKTRLREGIKLVELARRVGVNSPQLSKFETGQQRVSSGMLLAMAKAMNVETSELFPRREMAHREN